MTKPARRQNRAVSICISMTRSELNEIKKLARKDDRSVSSYIRRAVFAPKELTLP